MGLGFGWRRDDPTRPHPAQPSLGPPGPDLGGLKPPEQGRTPPPDAAACTAHLLDAGVNSMEEGDRRGNK